jgi:hypothetical protein
MTPEAEYPRGVDSAPARREAADPVPALALLAFWFGVLAGLAAVVGFVLVVGSGIAGQYSDGALAAWAAASVVMIALFCVAILIGVRETGRRGIDRRFIRRQAAVALGALFAAFATGGLTAANIGGSLLAVLADLLVVVFVATLIACNLQIWQRLKANSE